MKTIQGYRKHTHLGPYSYLKIMTWDKPLFKIDVIAGTIKDLYFLSKLILDKLNNTKPRETFLIDEEYSNANEARIIVTLMPDKFDLVTMDKQLNTNSGSH